MLDARLPKLCPKLIRNSAATQPQLARLFKRLIAGSKLPKSVKILFGMVSGGRAAQGRSKCPIRRWTYHPLGNLLGKNYQNGCKNLCKNRCQKIFLTMFSQCVKSYKSIILSSTKTKQCKVSARSRKISKQYSKVVQNR